MPRILVLLAVLAAGLPAPAFAHAILLDSRPALGGSVPPGPATVSLRFNSRIDRARSRLLLRGPDGTEAVLPVPADGPPDRLEAPADLLPGSYTVRWQVLAVDGHITRGDVPFTVSSTGAPAPSQPQAAR